MIKAMKLLILTVVLGLLPQSSFAESAMSALGYGLMNYSAGARSAGMGNLNLSSADSLGININAPALWGNGSKVRYTVAGQWLRTSSKDDNASSVNDDNRFSSIALVVPIGQRNAIGLTLSDYTKLNYQWTFSDSSNWTTIRERNVGRGSIAQAMLAFSHKINSNVNAAIGARLLAGNVERLWRMEFPEQRDAVQSGLTISDRYRGVGMHASLFVNDLHGYNFGAMFNTPIEAWSERKTLFVSNSVVVLDSVESVEPGFDFPMELGLGAGKHFGKHFIGADIRMTAWGDVESPAEMSSNLNNSFKLSLGWEYTPDYRAFDPSWKRLTYRGGLWTSNHYHQTKNSEDISILGLSGGISLPTNNNLTRYDIALNWTQYDTKDYSNLSESFLGITVSIVHSEVWFVQRRSR